jgi:hypothetical protein
MTPGARTGSQPERIGRYRILERIGKGAMGVIYSARDEVMDRTVALKVMMTDLEGEPETRARFYREAQAAGRLFHPNIITIFDMGEEEGHIYIVMELLRGETLSERLKRPGATTLEQKISMMAQVCLGLAAAHAHGIFHRDIKPSNLFVQPDGSIKILDFGVARLASSTMTASGLIIGTPDYMSPEQARGAEVDQRSDIFSAAAVFYSMLSGCKPFAGPDLPSVLRKVQLEDPPPLPESDVPAPLARIVTRSLAKSPALRHQSMVDLGADLTKFRRYYEAETRQIAATARDRYEAIEELVKERAALSDWLGVPAPDDEPAVARRLRETHRPFVEQGHDALLMVPFTRLQIAEIAAALCAEHQPLARAVSRLRDARCAVEAGEQVLEAGRPEDAVSRLDEAAALLPESARLRRAREQAQRALAEREVREAHLAALAAETRAAIDAQNWAVAAALADEALAVEPRAAEFAALRARAREALDREARVRARERQWSLDRVRRAIGDRRFDLAEEEIARARQLDARADEVEPLERLMAESRQAAAAEAASARRAAEAIGAARSAFQAGQRDQAVAVLQACLEVDRSAPGVARELQFLTAEIRRLGEAERRRAEAAAHLDRAARASHDGDLPAAARAAADALAVEPGNVEAARLHAIAQAGLRAEAAARDRRARAAERLERARALLESGATARAAREAQRVLELEAGNAEALDLIAAASRLDAEREAARERDRHERDLARTALHELKAARHAVRSGQAHAAEAAVARVLASDPGNRTALALIDEIAALRTRLKAAEPEQSDDTVSLETTGSPDDDTVAMTAPGEQPLVSRLGSRLKTFWRGR